jgi:hypothetical protein
MKDAQRATIDYLDIEQTASAWDDKKAEEYEAAGIVQVVEYPTTSP